MRIGVLGAVELVADGSGVPLRSPRLRRLLVALLVRAGEVVSVERLAVDVWGTALPADPVNAVQILVSRLRRVLGPEPVLRTRAPGYVLDRGGTDADAFERLLTEARAAGEPARVAALLDEALGLWRGAAFAELADEEFVRPAAVRLEELRLEAEAERVDAALHLGRADEAVARLEPLVGAHPLREALRGRLVLALYRAGRLPDALECYAQYRRVLAEELGVDPSRPLQELHERVLRQDPELAGPARPAPRPTRHRGRGPR